ncbi:uncharacterized protein LOC116274431 [Papio anubis]|uniref:uncharacterized protein LOC116274431 n=1 Tax=Papio anubis TaxID=9555 RepID=UPI0012AE19FB|nr:uncharacterized protein LOC116274431 [Papio anubis]
MWAGSAGGRSATSAAAGPGAKPFTALGWQGQLAAWSAAHSAGARQKSRWTVSAACSPGSTCASALHTSLQAEGAGSGLSQPGEGLLQCSGRLKGSSSAARVDAKVEEALRVRAASTLSPLTCMPIISVYLSVCWLQ